MLTNSLCSGTFSEMAGPCKKVAAGLRVLAVELTQSATEPQGQLEAFEQIVDGGWLPSLQQIILSWSRGHRAWWEEEPMRQSLSSSRGASGQGQRLLGHMKMVQWRVLLLTWCPPVLTAFRD